MVKNLLYDKNTIAKIKGGNPAIFYKRYRNDRAVSPVSEEVDVVCCFINGYER